MFRSFDFRSFKRSLLYGAIVTALLAVVGLFTDGAFVAQVWASIPDWANTIVTTFLAVFLAALGRAKDGRT